MGLSSPTEIKYTKGNLYRNAKSTKFRSRTIINIYVLLMIHYNSQNLYVNGRIMRMNNNL